MKLCNDTITVFNAKASRSNPRCDGVRPDRDSRRIVVRRRKVHGRDANGLKAASQYTIRIPLKADAGGKSYVDPVYWRNSADVAGLYTLNEGDLMVLTGAYTEHADTTRTNQSTARCNDSRGHGQSTGHPTPRIGKVVGGSSVTIKAAFQWNGDGDLLRAKNLETGGRVQTANIHNAVISYCMPSTARGKQAHWREVRLRLLLRAAGTGDICNAVCQIPVLRGGHGAEHSRVRGRCGNAYTVLFAARTGEAPDRQGADLPKSRQIPIRWRVRSGLSA